MRIVLGSLFLETQKGSEESYITCTLVFYIACGVVVSSCSTSFGICPHQAYIHKGGGLYPTMRAGLSVERGFISWPSSMERLMCTERLSVWSQLLLFLVSSCCVVVLGSAS